MILKPTKLSNWKIKTSSIIVLFLLLVAPSAFSQETPTTNKITIQNNTIKVKTALDMVRKQSGMFLMYEEATIPNTNIALSLKDATLKEALDVISKKAGLKYEFVDNYVLITAEKKQSKKFEKSKVSLNLKNSSVPNLLRELEKQSGVQFKYNNEDLNSISSITFSATDKPLEDVLQDVLVSRGIDYSFSDNTVILNQIADPNAILKGDVDSHQVIGKVVDESGEPLIGAHVMAEGTKHGTTTDIGGHFELMVNTAKGKKARVTVSYVGMTSQTVTFNNKLLKIVLEESNMLEEVVITGIFDRPKESFTGAATAISKAKLDKAGSRSVITSIRNIDPSFNIVQNLNIGSDPNILPEITMRGRTAMPTSSSVEDLKSSSSSLINANMPLFILDGFQISLQQLNDMNDDQIQSITILKDASATALYGSRGSNGVVVITRKTPQTGRPRISYSGSMAIEAPDFSSYNLMNASEKLRYELAAGVYDGETPEDVYNNQLTYNLRAIEIARGVDTYWLKYPVHVGVGQQHNVGIEGGDAAIRYNIAFSYRNTAGVMRGSNRDNLNGNMSFSYRMGSLNFRYNFGVVNTKAFQSPYGTFYDYGRLNPYWTPYDNNGNIIKIMEDKSGQGAYFGKTYNPLYNASLPQKNQSQSTILQNNLAIDWSILPTLILRSTFSYSNTQGTSDVYVSNKNTEFDNTQESERDRRGRYNYGTSTGNSYEGQITLNYNVPINEKKQLFLGFGGNIGQSSSNSYGFAAEGFAIADADFINMAKYYAKNGKPSGSESISRRVGLLFNANYNYDSRYFADFSANMEGSSQFGSSNRFAPFWSIGVGWNVKNEFFKESEFLSNLRLRTSYGVTGSQGFDPFQSLRMYTTNNDSYLGMYGFMLQGIGNPNLKWQSVKQNNYGFDASFLSKLNLTFEMYRKITNNMLTDIRLPLAGGFSSYRTNLGKILNEGFEVSASATVLEDRSNDFNLILGASLSYNRNEIKEVSEELKFLNQKLIEAANKAGRDDDGFRDPTTFYEEGQSLNTLYAVPSLGIDPSTGKEIYVKSDGSLTYEWSASDQKPMGEAQPKFNGNMNISSRLKGFTLTSYFNYYFGGVTYNNTLASKVENVDPSINNDRRVFFDRWKSPGDISYFKAITDQSSTRATSRFVQKNRFLQLSSIDLRYQIPAKWSRKYLKSEYVTLAGNMEDVFYISTIDQERGISYPFSRKFSLSLTVRF